MRCDVCNAEISEDAGECITPEVFTYLLDNGFGIDETNIKMLTDIGMSRVEAEEAIKQQYRASQSDWLLCPGCAAKAEAIVAAPAPKWVTPNFIEVTRTAEEVGLGFSVIGAPVVLSRTVWEDCVEWTDADSRRQTDQEQDARLWDVLFTCGATLQARIAEFRRQRFHRFSTLCVPRDGQSTEAVPVGLAVRTADVRGLEWLVIEMFRR